eukprot:m.183615 g.183615  ORF g.183615 m.183615 type:complete len:1137 (+) comp15547_c0_seq2:255-3665(+)
MPGKKPKNQRRRTVSESAASTIKRQVSFNLELNDCRLYSPQLPKKKKGRPRIPLESVRQRFDGSGWDIDGFIERQRTESLSQTEDDSSMPPSEAESSESDEKRLNGKKRKKKKKKELELLNKELENSNNNEESSIQSQVPLDNDKIVASEDRTENFNSETTKELKDEVENNEDDNQKTLEMEHESQDSESLIDLPMEIVETKKKKKKKKKKNKGANVTNAQYNFSEKGSRVAIDLTLPEHVPCNMVKITLEKNFCSVETDTGVRWHWHMLFRDEIDVKESVYSQKEQIINFDLSKLDIFKRWERAGNVVDNDEFLNWKYASNQDGSSNYGLADAVQSLKKEGLQKNGVLNEVSNTSLCGAKDTHELHPDSNMAVSCLSSVRHDWYETEAKITLVLFSKNISKHSLNINHSETHSRIFLESSDLKKKLIKIEWFKAIDPELCTHILKSMKLELSVFKKEHGLWNQLEKQKVENIETKPVSDNVESIPSKSNVSVTKIEPVVKEKVQESNQNQGDENENTKSAPQKTLVSFDGNGDVGLRNLGNTCFMNCIIQCLSHTSELRDVFLQDHYLGAINKDNPLGTGGRLAKAYASLMKQLWSKLNVVVAPTKLKTIIGKMNTTFSGLNQQDAQEFMTFLLDYLHEDLNRIKKKPYIEEPDAAGRPDREVALEAWQIYKKRNDSFLDDIFQGQERSKLTCPECGHMSVRFGNFSSLSIPLPQKIRLIEVWVVSQREPIVRYGVRVPRIGAMSVIISRLSQYTPLARRSSRLQLCVLYRNQLKMVSHTSRLEKLPEDAIVHAYYCSPTKVMVRVVQMYLNSVESKECEACKKNEDEVDTSLLLCSRCKQVKYCCVACQKNDWAKHKSNCKKIFPVIQGSPFLIEVADDGFKLPSYNMLLSTSKLMAGRIGSDLFKDASLSHVNELGQSVSVPSVIMNSKTPKAHVSLGRMQCVGLIWKGDKIETSESDMVEHPSLKETEEDRALKNMRPSLRGALELFQKPEVLEPSEAWYCSKCSEHVEATKEMSVWKAPKVLVLHLKRFSFRNILWKDKLDFMVDYPTTNLDISDFTSGPKDGDLKYDLYGVARHHGSIWGGHYTAFCRDIKSNKWQEFDDERVRTISEEKAGSCKDAYILFYRRKEDTDC